jgi:hypothetical protein
MFRQANEPWIDDRCNAGCDGCPGCTEPLTDEEWDKVDESKNSPIQITDDSMWCPDCQAIVESFGSYNAGEGGFNYCGACGSHAVEELAP